jgi:lipopolysaccharide/colanic/teichoic acid biosynthesis glycosyltransferase
MLYHKIGKRMLDLGCASFALIILSPVLLAIALLVKIKLGSPVIFRQMRPGQGEKLFPLFKFRTMTEERDATENLLPDNQRLTLTGELLRRTSLDELPELFNVLRAEMSFVGPRPLLVRYLPYFSAEERQRFTVLPGITGLAQVRGRNDLPWNSRLKQDVEYVNCLSFGMDLKILWDTAFTVLRRRGYQADPNATMLDFDEERRMRLESR